MIQLTFVYILYSLCILFVHTKSINFKFQAVLSFVQFVHFLYIYRNLMYIFCTFIIIQNFDLYNLCIQNIYKFSVSCNFCIDFV